MFQSSYLLEIKFLLHYCLAKQAIIDSVLSVILFDDIAAKREKLQEKLRNNIGRGWYQELPIFSLLDIVKAIGLGRDSHG